MDMLVAFFAHNASIEYVRYQWVDYSGVLHAKVIPKAYCLSMETNDKRVSLAQNCLIVPISTAPDCFPVGPQRWELSPDWSSLRVCHFKPNHAMVMCFLTQVEPPGGAPFEKCPRQALYRAMDAFGDETRVLIGYEIEFVLLDEHANLASSLDRNTGFASMAGLRGEGLLIMEEVCEALRKSDIAVQDFHTEIADQFEVVLSPEDPVRAIDALMLAQETIRSITIKHGVKASLAPRPVISGPQNGLHTHVSLNPLPKNAASFLQGVLENLGSLCVLGMPNFDSYVRVVEDGAGCYISWGTENRDLPIRKIGDRWEFRCVDATANHYLFLAALLSAGYEGMKQNSELRFKDCMEFQESITAVKMASYGISERMPNTLSRTIEAAKHSDAMTRWLGKPLIDEYIRLKEREVIVFQSMHDEERRRRYLRFF
jgi:glutamine synthetase